MPSAESQFNSLVYPIHGSLQWKIDNVLNSGFPMFSDSVKVGKCAWRLGAKKVDNGKVLLVGLICDSTIPEGQGGVLVHSAFRLVNHSGNSDKRTELECFFETNKTSFYSDLIDCSEMVLGKYVKDGHIQIESSFRIEFEQGIKRRTIDFHEERPNTEDLKRILSGSREPRFEQFEKAIPVSMISETGLSVHQFSSLGYPAKLNVRKNFLENVKFNEKSPESMVIELFVNWTDKSKWWLCQAVVEVEIGNNATLLRTYTPVFQNRCSSFRVEHKWDTLVDFVRNGQLRMRVAVRLVDNWGVFEWRNALKTPMSSQMTDVIVSMKKSSGSYTGEHLNVSASILAQQSAHFRKLLAESPRLIEVRLGDGKSEDFIRFLELVHNVDTDICEDNAEGVLEIIDRFKAPECFERIDVILKRQELRDPMKVFEWVNKYPLPRLKNLIENIGENLRFHTNFEEETQLTDVKIEVDGRCYYANKQILASASSHFMDQFYGPFPTEGTIFLSLVRVDRLLTHIYHPTTPVTSAQLDSLLELARQFQVLRLMDKCEEFLVLNGSIPLIDKLEYSGKYDLPYLLESCLKFVRNTETMAKVKADPKYRLLPQHIIDRITQREGVALN